MGALLSKQVAACADRQETSLRIDRRDAPSSPGRRIDSTEQGVELGLRGWLRTSLVRAACEGGFRDYWTRRSRPLDWRWRVGAVDGFGNGRGSPGERHGESSHQRGYHESLHFHAAWLAPADMCCHEQFNAGRSPRISLSRTFDSRAIHEGHAIAAMIAATMAPNTIRCVPEFLLSENVSFVEMDAL